VSDLLDVPQGTLRLARYPVRAREQLRAWDAADELLLAELAAADTAPVTVVLNDDFGAISVALARREGARVHHVSDSFISHCATRANLAANGIEADRVVLRGSLDPLPERIDLLVIRVPKPTALLAEQLRVLRPHLHQGTTVIGAAMTRHLHTAALDVFADVIGPTRTSLATRKARLVFATVDPASTPTPSHWPVTWRPATRSFGDRSPVVVAYAGVFAAEQLDTGTALLLDALAADRTPPPEGAAVVDLACGTGVVGVHVALADPAAQVTFVDESFAAVASAAATWRATFGPDRPARFVVGDCLDTVHHGEPIAAGSADRVIVNPPFHSGHALTDAIAWDMFVQSRRVLRRGGDLWVVGNRHLGYHVKLKRVFGNAAVVASNAHFVVVRATRAESPARPTRGQVRR